MLQTRTIRCSVAEESLPEGSIESAAKSSRIVLRELLDLVCPQISASCLKQGLPMPRTEDALLKLDEQPVREHFLSGDGA